MKYTEDRAYDSDDQVKQTDEGYIGQPVSEEAARLEKAAAALAERLDVLIGRLTPVLTPDYPVPEKLMTAMRDSDNMAPLARQLREVRDRLGRVESSIESVLGRVQV